MTIYELHNHTTFSDGKGSPEQMIEKAIELGYKTIGITDHICNAADGHKTAHFHISFAELPDYANTLNTLKEKYRSKINLLWSVELDYYNYSYMPIYNELKKYRPDYYLGSVHSLNNGINPWSDFSDFTDDEFTEFAVNMVKKDIDFVKTGTLDILGHFDAFKFYHGIKDESVLYPLYDELALALKENNTALEFNTGYGKEFVFDPYIFEKCKEYNIKVMLGSDAHEIDDLSRNFEEAVKYLATAGIKPDNIE